jgi:hypothetical protein
VVLITRDLELFWTPVTVIPQHASADLLTPTMQVGFNLVLKKLQGQDYPGYQAEEKAPATPSTSVTVTCGGLQATMARTCGSTPSR